MASYLGGPGACVVGLDESGKGGSGRWHEVSVFLVVPPREGLNKQVIASLLHGEWQGDPRPVVRIGLGSSESHLSHGLQASVLAFVYPYRLQVVVQVNIANVPGDITPEQRLSCIQ